MGRPTNPLLTPRRIADAALEMIAETGDVQMVQLAKRLGVAPSSLYHHVAGKAELIDLARTWMLESIDVPAHHDSWQEAVDHLLRLLARSYARHRRILPLIFATTVSSEQTIAVYEPVLQSLLEAGFDPSQLRLVVAAIDFQALGLAHGFPAPAMSESIREHLPAYATSIDHSVYGFETAIDFSAETLVLGLVSVLERTRSRGRPDR